MNIALAHPASDLPRRGFSAEDVRRMVEVGVIGEHERVELVGGELLVMAAKGYAHELIKSALSTAVIRAAPDDLEVGIEMTLQFADDVLLEPDIAMFPRSNRSKSAAGFVTLAPGACTLVIEVAASSLRYDKNLKSRLYASLGVREFWVVDANERTTSIHTGPSGEGWADVVERGPHDVLMTPALPSFSIRLADIA